MGTFLCVNPTTRARRRSAVRGAIALALSIVAVSGAFAATHTSGDIEQDRAVYRLGVGLGGRGAYCECMRRHGLDPDECPEHEINSPVSRFGSHVLP